FRCVKHQMRDSRWSRLGELMSYSDSDGTIRRRSGWLIPLCVFLVTLILSALVLLYYLAPSAPSFLEEQIVPTSRTDPTALRVHGLKLCPRPNSHHCESARQDGPRKDLALSPLLPDMAGWSNWEPPTFSNNSPESPVVYLLIREESLNLSKSDRLSR